MQQEMALTPNPFVVQGMNRMPSARLHQEDAGQVSYLENSVLTASREELILMLYDGALKFTRRGLYAIEAKDFPSMNYNLLRAQKIVHYLNLSLDMDQGQEIAINLARLYDFVMNRLNLSQREKDQAAAQEGMDILHTLRQAWYEAFMQSKETNEPV